MATHHLPPERRTTHGPFDASRPPVLTVEDGDTVVFRTLDSGWSAGAEDDPLRGRGFERDAELDVGHALCGPVAVAGARAGDVLEITIGEIRPGTTGFTWAGPRDWMEEWQRLTASDTLLRWHIDPDRGTASDGNGLGLTLDIRPFLGVMGNAPAAPGRHSTGPPRKVGGNLDCKELVTGSTLWLPIEVDGALFSVGDGHALQADGEVSCTAIECPMERVELTFHVRRGLRIAQPTASTPAGYVVMGLGEDLDRAMWDALSGMLDHLEAEYSLTRSDALALASLVVDMRVTQVVNGTLGCHALLPPGVLQDHSRPSA